MPPDPLEGVVPSALPLMQFVTSQHLYPPFYPPHRTLLEPPLVMSEMCCSQHYVRIQHSEGRMHQWRLT